MPLARTIQPALMVAPRTTAIDWNSPAGLCTAMMEKTWLIPSTTTVPRAWPSA